MTNAKTVLLIAIVLSLISSPVLAVVEFKDGQTHNIDYEINDWVWVDYMAPGMQTTVNLLDGGWIHCLEGFENSHVTMSSGSIGGYLWAYDSSQVDISSGSIGTVLNAWDTSQVEISGGSIGWWVKTFGSSQVGISGGSIGGWLYTYGSSQVDISGGSIGSLLYAHGSSQVDISGGSIGTSLQTCNNSQVTMSGGSIGTDLKAWNSSQVTVSGGSIGDDLWAADSSQVGISGGSIGDELVSTHWAILTIHGSDFAVDGAPFGYGELTSILGGYWENEPCRHLTGTLLSGEPIDNDFYIGHDASILLVSEWVLMVEIDIKPGSYPNAINLASHGLIPVAILSDEQFDATSVDPDTVELAEASVVKRGKSNKYMAHEEDVNGDGLVDLVVQVETANLDPSSFQDGYAVLTGKTYDGQAIQGQDEITIIPPALMDVSLLMFQPSVSSADDSVPPDPVSPPTNLALNPSRSGYPHPLVSDRGWGGGSDKWEIVDGIRAYPPEDPGAEWWHGLAFTGGKAGYIEPCGWRQATINFGEPKTFNRVLVWWQYAYPQDAPNTYIIQYWDGTDWVDIFSTTNGSAYMKYPMEFPHESWWQTYNPTENIFDPVTSSKVRLTLYNCDMRHGWITDFEVYMTPLQVTIDIKPGSYPNAINLDSHGLIPVAILSDEEFDATTVDPGTVELAGASVVKRGKGNKFMAHEEDVNADGITDLVVQVETQNLQPEQFQDGYAVLNGTTYGGQDIKGEDEITIVPPGE